MPHMYFSDRVYGCLHEWLQQLFETWYLSNNRNNQASQKVYVPIMSSRLVGMVWDQKAQKLFWGFRIFLPRDFIKPPVTPSGFHSCVSLAL